jgi:hypothetical protein
LTAIWSSPNFLDAANVLSHILQRHLFLLQPALNGGLAARWVGNNRMSSMSSVNTRKPSAADRLEVFTRGRGGETSSPCGRVKVAKAGGVLIDVESE